MINVRRSCSPLRASNITGVEVIQPPRDLP
jgi:hypothetical protein